MVFTAHIDAYENSPGALDNASGIVVLMLLAEMLRDYSGELGIELVAFNGEDHYSAGGEMDYLNRFSEQLNQVYLTVNVDEVGYYKGRTGYSFYNCSSEQEQVVRGAFRDIKELVPGAPWYNGDHMIFVQKDVPSMAITAELIQEIMGTIAHTSQDKPSMIDPVKLVEISHALSNLVKILNDEPINEQSI